ncbi:prepilin-type N-terminal cleavage/methylation domain-containing protein [Geobacillus stearothermophilus]|uniref:prepilin-type N-terminal cleavage/methylation domain-containing protein n=1 Tax=Geobacillus stearothermophilus TaxID=1422 RepID=UPI002E1B3353|nr:prepilin-type N-terminal cleavage/methylation domain-containing protein [Geobacillus stearothermophilus]
MFKRVLKNERGLTLIELLAVIVILGIIAAIAIPSIGGIINKSKNDAKIAEGIQIINAAKMYMTANSFTPDSANSSIQTLDETDLNDYLDSVDDSQYKVEVRQGNSGKYTYYLKEHDSVGLVDTNNDGLASEEELSK